MTKKIKDQLGIYKQSKKTPERHLDIIKAYKYLPNRIINILITDKIVVYEEKNTIAFDEECLKIYYNKINSKLISAEDLLSKYFKVNESR